MQRPAMDCISTDFGVDGSGFLLLSTQTDTQTDKYINSQMQLKALPNAHVIAIAASMSNNNDV